MLDAIQRTGKLKRKKSDDLAPTLFPPRTFPTQIFNAMLGVFSELLKLE